MNKLIAATAFAALFAAAPAMAADAPNADPGVNTGKQARTPADNSVGIKGAPGNKNGPSMKSDSSNGSSSGEMGKSGTSSSDEAAGVKGAEGGKNGPSAKDPGSTQ
ncbi:hypothetical protein [Hyphomicrobium sp.]|jgi:hypothetical protein|uniref:hypothetical protein n=1 Tax=Hyphomicrobium sp. TaxID=82 RepID=UPI002C436161|nr:hypothetical protein [Hyphomicrobium sp.]HVZ05312.1 hypothetical protein [Hyphomicrobium sp.]